MPLALQIIAAIIAGGFQMVQLFMIFGHDERIANLEARPIPRTRKKRAAKTDAA